MIVHVFTYRQKISYTHIYPIAAFIVFTIYFGVNQYGISLRKWKLLEYPNSLYALSILSVVFITYALYRFIVRRRALKNPNHIIMKERSFDFPHGSSGKVSIDYNQVDELWNKTESNDGELIILYVKNPRSRYTFKADYFASNSEFSLFKDMIIVCCSNITNK
ncbi:MAG: hypothetical protein QM802_21310 [Agriterribacter sp.]